jgi:uncharacterized membrane protein
MHVEDRDRTTVLIHYYRAMVGRADVWRMRMDATTNWAIGATAAVISFALGDPASPHFLVFIAVLLTLCFLLLEARRLVFYHLWQQRVLQIERGLIRPALRAGASAPEPAPPDLDLVASLDPHLGSTIPTMPIGKAVARRMRRIYLYLFAVQLIAWTWKLSSHPTPTESLAAGIARAHLGPVPGTVVVSLVGLAFLAAVGLALARGGIDAREASRDALGAADRSSS